MNDQRGYRELDTWQQAMTLVERIYLASEQLPQHERYGLCSQIRRAAVSIPSNVAEGHCRRTTRAYANHVAIALGSQGELETCVEMARRLKMITDTNAQQLEAECAVVGRMLSGLHAALERKLLAAEDTRGR